MIEPNPKHGGLRMRVLDIGLNEDGLYLEDLVYHESGHAVAAAIFELVLNKVTVFVYQEQSKTMVRGETDWSPQESVVIPDEYVAASYCGILAATKARYPRVAVQYLPHFFTPSLKSGAKDDFAQMDSVRKHYEDLDLFDEKEFEEDLRTVIEDYWPAIEEVAQRLQDTRTLSGDEVRAIVERRKQELGK